MCPLHGEGYVGDGSDPDWEDDPFVDGGDDGYDHGGDTGSHDGWN